MGAALPALVAVLQTSILGVPAPVAAPAATGGAPQQFGGTGAPVRAVPTRRSARPASRHPSNGHRGANIGEARTCTTYQRSRAVRVCAARGGSGWHCRRPRAGSAAAVASANVDVGWWAPHGPSAMGRLWITHDGVTGGLCSGTMVTPDVLLTAGHCLWNDGDVIPGAPRGYISDRFALTFVPANAFAANGVEGEAATAVAPHGSWRVVRSYVPACWARAGDPHCDVGLAMLGRSRAGR